MRKAGGPKLDSAVGITPVSEWTPPPLITPQDQIESAVPVINTAGTPKLQHGAQTLAILNSPPTRAELDAGLAQAPLDRYEVEALLLRLAPKLGVRFELDLDRHHDFIAVLPGQDFVNVPIGLLSQPGLTLDGLTVILAHEAAHVRGIRDEAHADDWAAREGLRLAWGSSFDPRRALHAAYSALHSLQTDEQPLNPTLPPGDHLEIYVTSYGSVQARFAIYQRGIQSLPHAMLVRLEEGGVADLISNAAAAEILQLPLETMLLLEGRRGTPRSAKLDAGVLWLEPDLDAFRMKVRNRVQMALALELSPDREAAGEWLGENAIRFAERWDADESFRAACFLAWPFEGSIAPLAAQFTAQRPE